MSLRRIASCVLLAIAAGGVLLSAAPSQAQLLNRWYGYRPRTYGYWPSAYVYPRYGFEHGEIYTTHIGYGEPGFGQRQPGQQGPGGPGSFSGVSEAGGTSGNPAGQVLCNPACGRSASPEGAIVRPAERP